jgi:MFS family permease
LVKKETTEYRGMGGGSGMGMDGAGMDMGGGMGRFAIYKRTFRSFKNPVYRLYFGALLGQMASMNMQMFARMWLVYRLTESPAIMGAMSFAHAIPMLSLSLFGGVIADRVHKKYVMLVGQLGSAVVSLAIALSLAFGYLSSERVGSLWILIVASVAQGIIMALMMPSRQAILPEIVGEEQLMNAVSLTTMGMNVLQILAPALTGFLIGVVDYEGVYYIMTGLYLVSTAFIIFIPRTGTISVRGGGAMADIKAGVKYIRHKTIILLILVFVLFTVLLSMPYRMLMPVICVEVLDVAEEQGGVLTSVAGVGAMVASLVLASLPNKKRGLMLLISGLVLGLALVGFSASGSWYLSMGLIAFVGLGQTGRMTLSNTLLQYYVEDEYRGRVMSVYLMQFGLNSFGTFLAGVLAEGIGVQWAIGGFAGLLVFLAILALTFVPRLRRLE